MNQLPLRARGAALEIDQFAIQAETMKKLKGTGEQRVVVEHRHYHLAPGSQAVFGDIVKGEGVSPKIEDQSHERGGMLLSERDAMLGALETHGLQVSGTGGVRKDSLPVSRGQGRST